MQIDISIGTDDKASEVCGILSALLAHFSSTGPTSHIRHVAGQAPITEGLTLNQEQNDFTIRTRMPRAAKLDPVEAYNALAKKAGAPTVDTSSPSLPAATVADIAETEQEAPVAQVDTPVPPPSGEEDVTPTEAEVIEQAAIAGAALSIEEKRAFIKTKLMAHGVPWAMANLGLPKSPGIISSWPDTLVASAYELALIKG